MNSTRVLKKILCSGILVSMMVFSGCQSIRQVEVQETAAAYDDPYYNTTFENYKLNEGFDIRQYEGVKLDFIVENNIYGSFLLQESARFTQMTGIEVNIRPVDYSTLAQKVNLDFIGQTGNYDLIYVDPYQTLSKFSKNLEPLNPYIAGEKGAVLQSSWGDYYDYQLASDGLFLEEDLYYALPFDATSLVLFYRKDIFEKYKDAFYEAYGYDWTPTQPDFTWEKYKEVSRWITEHVPKEEVVYGSGEMALHHNALFCEVLNIYGSLSPKGDQKGIPVGISGPDFLNIDPEILKETIETYKALVDLGHPESRNWQWAQTSEAFASNEIAMMMNWDENYYLLGKEMGDFDSDKVGIAPIPLGENERISLYGGSGIGINKDAPDLEKEAAWFYMTWATSPQVQKRLEVATKGKFMTSLKSINEDASRFNDAYYEVMMPLVEDRKYFFRPKMSQLYALEDQVTRQVIKVLDGEITAQEASRRIIESLKNEAIAYED